MYGNSRKAVSFAKELYQGKKEGQAQSAGPTGALDQELAPIQGVSRGTQVHPTSRCIG